MQRKTFDSILEHNAALRDVLAPRIANLSKSAHRPSVSQLQLEELIEFLLGRKLQKPLKIEAIEPSVRKLFEVVNRLINQQLFNEATKKIVWNILHSDAGPDLMIDGLTSFLEFIQLKKDFFEDNPELLLHLEEFTANPPLPNFDVLSLYLTYAPLGQVGLSQQPHPNPEPVADLKDPEPVKFSKVGFQIILNLARNNIDFNQGLKALSPLLAQNILALPFVQKVLIKCAISPNEFAAFANFLMKLNNEQLLNAVTVGAFIKDNDYFIQNIFNYLRKNNLFPNTDNNFLSPSPSTRLFNRLPAMLTKNQFAFNLLDATQLAGTNHQAQELFEPLKLLGLLNRIVTLAKEDVAPTFPFIKRLFGILAAWHPAGLINYQNMKMLLDYQFIFDDGVFISECEHARDQGQLSGIFARFKLPNLRNKILNGLKNVSDPYPPLEQKANISAETKETKSTPPAELKTAKQKPDPRIAFLEQQLRFLKDRKDIDVNERLSLLDDLVDNLMRGKKEFILNNIEFVGFILIEIFDLKDQPGINKYEHQRILNECLHRVIIFNNTDLIQELLSEGALPTMNLQHETIWHTSARYATFTTADFIRTKIGEEQSYNAPNGHGDLPLHLAVSNCNAPMVKFLVEKKVDVAAANKEGEQALHLLQDGPLKDAEAIVTAILAKNPDCLEAKNDYAWTPLRSALNKNCVVAVIALIKHGAKLHESEYGGDFQFLRDNVRRKLDVIFILLFRFPSFLTQKQKDCLWDRIKMVSLQERIIQFQNILNHYFDFETCLQVQELPENAPDAPDLKHAASIKIGLMLRDQLDGISRDAILTLLERFDALRNGSHLDSTVLLLKKNLEKNDPKLTEDERIRLLIRLGNLKNLRESQLDQVLSAILQNIDGQDYFPTINNLFARLVDEFRAEKFKSVQLLVCLFNKGATVNAHYLEKFKDNSSILVGRRGNCDLSDISVEMKQVCQEQAVKFSKTVFSNVSDIPATLSDHKEMKSADPHYLKLFWNHIKVLMVANKKIAQPLLVHFIQLINALDQKNLAEAARIAAAGLVLFPNSDHTKQIHEFFVGLLMLNGYPKDLSNTPFKWAAKHFPYCQPEAFHHLQQEANGFFAFLANNPADNRDFCNAFKLLFEQPVERGQLAHLIAKTTEASVSAGRQQNGLMSMSASRAAAHQTLEASEPTDVAKLA